MAANTPTINVMFQETVARHGGRVALMHKAGGKQYQSIPYADLARRVEQMASGLAAIGIGKGDRVAILSENRPEWVVTDLATLALGGISVPIYTTLPAPQVAYILRNSGARALVVSDAKQLQKALQAREEAPQLTAILAIDAPAPDNGRTSPADGMVHTFASVLERGAAQPLGEGYERAWKAVAPDDVASLVYTSGTTGDPKGAMLTHGNFMADVDATRDLFLSGGLRLSEEDVFLSFLPLSHVYERTGGYYLPLRLGASIGYTESIRTVRDNLAEVKPTLMISVPRLYESMQEQIQEAVAKYPERRRKLVQRAFAVGMECAKRREAGRSPGLLLSVQRFVFDKLVFSKMRERFGGRMRYFVAGGAALADDTARFFEAAGVPILQGYGMTETSPVIAANPADHPRTGTVGKIVPGVEVKIAGDGEILVRGPIVMKGYWDNPGATAETIDADGWLHTGDIGELKDGYLRITDRKKDILVLANGKNVAPQPIESALKGSPFLSEIVLIGDRQNVITALVVPNLERLRDWAKKQNLSFADDAALIASPETRRKIKAEIDAHSGHLADFEKIRKFTLLPAAFTVDGGELTPTLKVRRKVIAQKYAREIAEMRGGSEAAAAA
jgi:long-chain acyl-CoA synthetase